MPQQLIDANRNYDMGIENYKDLAGLPNRAKEIRDIFKSYRDTVKQIVDAIHASRANDAAAKAEERLAAIKAKVEELKAQGKDTSEVET